MQLSEELKILCSIFIAFLESTLSFNHFEKKEKELRSLSISEVIDSERRAYLNLYGVLFLKTLW